MDPGKCMVHSWLLLVFVLLVGLPQSLWAQADANAVGTVHTVSAGASTTWILDSDEPRTSAAGGDYMYRLNPKWEVGAQLDTDWTQGYESYEGYSIVPVAAYSVTDRFNVFMGVGFEHSDETGDNSPLARLGGEYTIYLSDDQQTLLLPGCFLDYGDGEFTFSLQLAIGYTW